MERGALTGRLAARNLTLFRGERCLFRDLSFALDPGGLLLLEGRNGSGKTSLMRAIAGLIELEEGTVAWDGRAVLEDRQSFYNNLVWMAHRVGFKADLTLVENLRFESALRPQSARDPQELFERLGIGRLKRLPFRSLSAGQQRRVALARMLLADVPLWMMDEPVTNLDREGRALVIELVREHLMAGGMAIMAAHQDIELDMPVTRVEL
jgi:heme exporter protein A